ncbi:MAG: thiamine pyrophosphate-dependent dehydrogenase E1 component subunit alpha [Rhodocyclaceae bacterium]|nr:thiamine pyrophosphate-dependent dehydrogenase E1 component subunit alpha [Rhodocyclaceae bacterium]
MTSESQSTDLAAALASMALIRAYEQKVAGLAAAGNFPSVCSSLGQEASAVGVVSMLGAQDRILTNHRSAGHLLARGADPGRMLAEVMGRSDGYCQGRSGSLHISVAELGVVLTSTIVGGELSLATGVALAQTMLNPDAIVACFFGDGAACEGIFHESLNLASVWNLPILYVCENNEWQAYVRRRETMLTPRIASWAQAYAMPALSVDGNDVEAVQHAARDAIAQVRATRRPFLLETCTYRMRGHMEPDDPAYSDAAELAVWRTRDPLERARDRLIERGLLTSEDYAELQAQAGARIEAALAYANASPWPAAGELTDNIYA